MIATQGDRETTARPDPYFKGIVASGALHILLVLVLIYFAFTSPVETVSQLNPGFPVELVELGPGSAVFKPSAQVPHQQSKSQASPSLSISSRSLLKVPPASANLGVEINAFQKTAKASVAGAPDIHKPNGAAESNAPPSAPDLQSQLQALALQQQNQAQAGQRNSAQVVEGGQPSTAIYQAKDFIREQIERHWILDRQAAGAGDFSISLHLELQSDGKVLSAEIINDSNLAGSAAYRSAALSLRGAALLSSPFVLPEGQYELVKNIELTFRPKDALQ